MKEVILNKDNFKEEVIDSSIPVLVDFWAVWCGPCQMIAPIIEEVANESDGSYKVGKVNCDDNNELCYIYNVESIPTLLLFKNGEVVKKHIGYCSKEEVLDLLK